MAQNVATIIVEKTGTLKSYCIKDYNEDELYKQYSILNSKVKNKK